ncbi:MAG: hypothetical protein NT169_21440 [Chloroflexi bacterium]|nr:hypothetical protein [Chloroflexota bacterium]
MSKRLLPIALLLALLVSAACVSQPILSATYNDAAKVARGWIEACQKGDQAKALNFWSPGFPDVAKYETEFLVKLYQETNFKLLAIEDRASLISSGELAAFIQVPNGQQGMILIYLANGERGPVIADVEYSDMSNQVNYYPGRSSTRMADDVRSTYGGLSFFWYR